jgi:hypothetical protein
LAHSEGLADNIYELVPSDTATPYLLVVVKTVQNLDATTEKEVAEMPHLMVLIKAYYDADTKRVLLKCTARQPSVGWYSFNFSVKAGKSCKARALQSIASRIREKKDRSQSKKDKLYADTTRMSRIESMFPRNEKMLKTDLDCLLRIPKDLSLIVSADKEMTMYEKMLLIEGDEPSFFSRAAYSDIWREPTEADPDADDIYNTDQWYSRLLLYLHKNPAEIHTVRRLVKKQRRLKKQIEGADRRSIVVPGLNDSGEDPYNNEERRDLLRRLQTEIPIEEVMAQMFETVPGSVSREIPVERRRMVTKLLGLVKKRKPKKNKTRQATQAEEDEEIMEQGEATLEDRPLRAEADALYSLLLKRTLGNGLRHQMYTKQLTFDADFAKNMITVDNCINSLYSLKTKGEIVKNFNAIAKKDLQILATECKPLPDDFVREVYNGLAPCGRRVRSAPRMDVVVSSLRASNPKRLAAKIKFRNAIMTVVNEFATQYKDLQSFIYQLGLDVFGLSESVPEQQIREYFEAAIDDKLNGESQRLDEAQAESPEPASEPSWLPSPDSETPEYSPISPLNLPLAGREPQSSHTDLLIFFHKQDLLGNRQWLSMNPTAQLECALPLVECLWEWVPRRADVIMGKYAWVHYTRVRDGEPSTVVWQASKGTCAVQQNQYRMIAAAFGVGPLLHNAFAVDVDGRRFEGFQTSFSQPPTRASNAVVRIDDHTSFRAVACLTQKGRTLPFQFKIREPAKGIEAYGSKPSGPNVWTEETLDKDDCAVGRAAWNKYLQMAASDNCKLSRTDLSHILRVSFPFANEAQKTELEASIGSWPTEGCQTPQILLNDWSQAKKFQWRRFKFLACGSFGCSFLWLDKSPKTTSAEVRKRVIVHTSAYFRKGFIRTPDIWWDTPLREFAMLEIFNKAGVAVKPLTKPQRTGESTEMLMLKKNIGYYSPIGEQYWTYGMQAGHMTLRAYIECGHLTETLEDVTNKVLAIFRKLQAAKYTHGDFHLGNLVILDDKQQSLKLIDFANSSNTVFMPWYDLCAFTTDCYSMAEPRIARELAQNVHQTLIADEAYQKIIDPFLYARLKTAKSFTNKEGDYLPMVKTREVRDHLFHTLYKHALTAEQLQTDGLAWYDALGIENGLDRNLLKECAQKSKSFVNFKYFVLTLLLAQ